MEIDATVFPMSGLCAYHPFPVPSRAQEITLSPSESAHLARSLRAQAGESVRAFDGNGRSWFGSVARADAGALVMRVESARQVEPPRPVLALAQVLPKGGLMDDIVRAAVEIGAGEIHPLFSGRCEVKLDAARAEARVGRWQGIAIEACKQSGNAFLPSIATPVALKTFLGALPPAAFLFAGSLEADAVELARLPAGEVASGNPGRLVLFIGPEGDFSPEEYSLLRRHGVRGVRLGNHVLRVPTAALYGLAALDQLRQRMG
ncbi:MAG: 16S rRNA (uracil(1498)-N(3))-methyltransferase [Puniceicoccales bacterium]|nr:16S rRNA (uracil(1498)-N(3))-methyltransferase [Puniceicoccales bacterium]